MKKFLASTFFFTVITGVVVLCVVTAVVSVGRREFPTAVVVIGIALAFAGLEAAVVLILRGKVNPRVDVGDHQTTIRPDLIVDRLLTCATVVAVAAVADYAIFAPQGKIDLPLPYGSQRMWTISAVVITLTGMVNVWSLFKRGGNSFQRLTRSGFELGQGVSTVRGDWDDVIEIADRRTGRQPPVRASLFVKFADGKIRTQAIDSYTPRGEALRGLVRYYWINPDRREELADNRAAERFAEFQSGP